MGQACPALRGILYFNGLTPQRAGVYPEQSGEKRVKGLRQIQGEILYEDLGQEFFSGVDDVFFIVYNG